MKKSLAFSALLVLTVLFSFHSIAQPGWRWCIGTTNNHNILTEGMSVAIDKSGNVFCGGWVNMYDTLSADSCKFGPYTMNLQNEGFLGLFVTKVDSSGNYQWMLGAHGTNHDYAAAMVTDKLGDLYVLFTFYDTFIVGTDTLTASSFNYGLMKVSSSGSLQWVKKLGGSGDPVEPDEQAIGIDGAGYIYISGMFSGSTFGAATVSPGLSVIISKLDPSGDVVWATGLGDPVRYIPYSGMAVSEDGSVYVTGTFKETLTSGSQSLTAASGSDQPYLVKLDSSGRTVWMSTSTESKLSYSAVTTDNHNRIYLGGYFQGAISYGGATFSPPLPGGYHVLTACLDTSSAIIWARAAYDTGNSGKVPYAIDVDRCGKVVVAIGYQTTNTPRTDYLVFGTDTLHVPDSSYDPIFVAEYDSSGNYVQGSALPSGGEDFFGAQIDLTGNLYICSDFIGPKMAVADGVILNTVEESFFVAKYHYDDMICPDKTSVKTISCILDEISLYPNPASGSFTISCTVPFTAGATLELLDMAGRRLRVCHLYGYNTEVPVTGLALGMYLCHILPGDGSVLVKKVAVE